ncbi:hypothetical protein SELMODRAFT_100233 [Selaginella moellendorffii]|uniref:PWI domain-containing protein n=1 Tax=Selaginella moellendorffii TaxID=88036 RepID=D8RRX3_SELML|nr:hypothetical protein SELMODRAFT_118260 [Selaginella moellendorffii]EFJ24771.1 hypothetical protein SELMODRAFT_100233 [Selaginella moellendorffii]
MSGGFFRGTSTEQDTRFSNKMAKLLKTQKFASELDQPIDMSKVNMDVMRPWIATRVTELLGFEDEVLINFIYGLLDVKVGDGKHIQIQLTGFMEKNTGRFMKELWGLLASAQSNASGIPQALLDKKALETQLKKRRRREEKRLRKEEKQRRREEKRKRKEEKRSLKAAAATAAVSSASARGPAESDVEQKKLEDDLRKKALESLKAKMQSS